MQEIKLGYFGISEVASTGALTEDLINKYCEMKLDMDETPVDMDEKILDDTKITLDIIYPVTTTYRVVLESDTGFTRKKLVELVCLHYGKMYREEEASTKQPTKSGKYGIWGHCLDDLVLHTVYIDRRPDGTTVVTFGVDS